MIETKPLHCTLLRTSTSNFNYQTSVDANVFHEHSYNNQSSESQDFLFQEPPCKRGNTVSPLFPVTYRDHHRSASSSSCSGSDFLSPVQSSPPTSSCSQEPFFAYPGSHPSTKQRSQGSYPRQFSHTERQHCCPGTSLFTDKCSLSSLSDDLCADLADIDIEFSHTAMNNEQLLPSIDTFCPSQYIQAYDDPFQQQSLLEISDNISDSGVSRSDSRSSDEEEPSPYINLTSFSDFYPDEYYNNSEFHTENGCNMCSCCPEPLDLRIDSKKSPSNHILYNNNFPEVYDSPFEFGSFPPTTYIPRYQDQQQNSPPSEDDGFYEDCPPSIPDAASLPLFDQLQKSETRCASERRRISTSSNKKKHITRDSPCLEKERRKPGRKPGQVSNVLHLWEFMRDLLRSPNNQGIIEWISKPEGVFRVVNSSEVARLWGEKKKNKKKMTYEKLSRSLRYSRLEGYFSDLPKDKNYPKKLCFKFGPKSNNWH
ncbi:myb protein I [Biomphalaria glabrata]|nr:myb protein I [Biomphalaria glabrata]